MDFLQDFTTTIRYHFNRAKYLLRGNNFSHAGEQKIVSKYIESLLPQDTPRVVVDIGAGNGMRWSNSYALLLADWGGVGIEPDLRKFAALRRAYQPFPKAQALCSKAAPENIGSLLKSLSVPVNFGVLSLDIDGNDYWVLQAILDEFRPGLIVTEINEKIPPPLRFVAKFDPHFRLRHHFYGYSIAALEDFCERHSYGILELEYNNAFLAPRELANACFVSAEHAYRSGYLERADRHKKFRTNSDLEVLQSLDALDALRYLDEFYRAEAGKYYLAPDKATFKKLMVG